MKAGFIGLGHLGKAMAKRLISEGVKLSVWNRTREKAADLGVEVADSPARLISDNEVVFINLFDSHAVRSVMTGRGGILEGNCRGKIVIDTSTNHFDAVNVFYDMLRGCNASYLEAPVLGSVVPAATGSLVVLVSGAKEAFDKARPYIEKIGKNIFYLEQPSFATKMKLVNNLALGVFMAAISEAVAFGEAAGIDKEKVLDILSAGAGNSAVLTAKKEKLLKDDFSTHFSSSLIYKDLHYLQDLAWELRRPLVTGSMVKELYGMTFSKNMEEMDFSAVYKVIKGL
ncbi:MAG TPA: NAD(P)-dependent oxidoreductase [Dissulfurispiraceae bacterium]